ncbi:hypothetical protein IQE94_17600 (plasmid) [Synechocystis sp. PCC 7339]|uniref:hypothetical protein n=1 Tax=Synechocystis sp. PCC 7339 TaxID=2782213 RepID=UPI001CBC0163|nr:hypothetical protein [Synechocystis sp. PCC 7339]UAJ74614.1 hypothetical protein IQE94_17600 [Synechocystis sp. PCC 7339]
MTNQNFSENCVNTIKDCLSIITSFHEKFYFLERIKEKINGLLCSLTNIFAYCSEPKISRKVSRYGDIYFEVYDPVFNKHMSFGSEQEVRTWLEHRCHY